MSFGKERKAWKDIWGSGQGVGAIKEVVPAAALVQRLQREYHDARAALIERSGQAMLPATAAA